MKTTTTTTLGELALTGMMGKRAYIHGVRIGTIIYGTQSPEFYRVQFKANKDTKLISSQQLVEVEEL